MDWVLIILLFVVIFVVFWKKEVILVLLFVVLCVEVFILLILMFEISFLVLINVIEWVVSIVFSFGNIRVILFFVLVGVLLVFICDFGGVMVIVNYLVNKGVVKSKK